MTKKLFLIPAVLLVLLCLQGCMPASQQEVLNLSNAVSQIVPAVRAVVAASSEETRDKVEIVLEQVEEVNTAVATAETPIEALKSGVAASAPVNPYAVPILVGLNLLEALGIWNEKKKVTGLKKGISRVTGEADKEDAKNIYETIKPYAKGLVGQKIL